MVSGACVAEQGYIWLPLTAEYKAIADLEDGKYTDAQGDRRDCASLCKNCIGGTEDECVECIDTATRNFEDSYGTCICADEFYEDGTSCLTCKNLCNSC